MTPAPLPAIDVDNVTKRFGKVTAVDRLSMTVQPGEIFGLVGPDGAGKSTTMRMLAGVMRPDSGTIRVSGFDVVATPENARQDISYMPQRFGLYEDLTVSENVRFYADLFGIPRKLREERTTRLLAAAGMLPFRGRLAGQLSGGMKQKLGLTCALIHMPRTLLLDEPTTGVDPVSRRDFWGILYSLRTEGVTVVISTAYLDEAERCHRLALLHGGRIMHCDTPAALKAKMPGRLLAIGSSSPLQVRGAVATLNGVASAIVTGGGVHVHVDDEPQRPAEIQQALMRSGIQFACIEAVAPTIEDLFAALLERPKDGPGG